MARLLLLAHDPLSLRPHRVLPEPRTLRAEAHLDLHRDWCLYLAHEYSYHAYLHSALRRVALGRRYRDRNPIRLHHFRHPTVLILHSDQSEEGDEQHKYCRCLVQRRLGRHCNYSH